MNSETWKLRNGSTGRVLAFTLPFCRMIVGVTLHHATAATRDEGATGLSSGSSLDTLNPCPRVDTKRWTGKAPRPRRHTWCRPLGCPWALRSTRERMHFKRHAHQRGARRRAWGEHPCHWWDIYPVRRTTYLICPGKIDNHTRDVLRSAFDVVVVSVL